jgi:hypothetical protein
MAARKRRGPASAKPQAGVTDVFLCHSGADKNWVRGLAEQIESETFDGTATGRKLKVFFDEWDIDVGQNFIVRLNEGLKKSRYVAVVLSPEMLEAPWPTFEWTHIVAGDPANAQGRIIPLFAREYSEKLKKRSEFPAPFLAINWIDFRCPKDFKKGFLKLIRKLRDQPPARGRPRSPLASAQPVASIRPLVESAAAPDQLPEVILGNLLPVQSYPQTVWYAPTSARRAKDVFDKVKAPPAFELQEKNLYTFADLNLASEELRSVIDVSRIGSVPLGQWKNDPVRWRSGTSLLNRCLRHHFSGLPIMQDDQGRFFFRPDQGGDRVWKNKCDPVRTVAARKTNATGTQRFWVHQGARLSFQALGDGLYLSIDPCYVFTADGQTPLKGKSVTTLASKWGGNERNAAILRHTVFWARTLIRHRQQIEIGTGASPIVVSGVPAVVQTAFGIENDRLEVRSLLTQVEDELALAAEALSDDVFGPDESEEEDDGE